MVEHTAENRGVAGSSPALAITRNAPLHRVSSPSVVRVRLPPASRRMAGTGSVWVIRIAPATARRRSGGSRPADPARSAWARPSRADDAQRVARRVDLRDRAAVRVSVEEVERAARAGDDLERRARERRLDPARLASIRRTPAELGDQQVPLAVVGRVVRAVEPARRSLGRRRRSTWRAVAGEQLELARGRPHPVDEALDRRDREVAAGRDRRKGRPRRARARRS